MEPENKEQTPKEQTTIEQSNTILKRLDKLDDENSALKEELHSLKNKKVGSLKKGATLKRPKYKADELSKRMPNDKFFNKVSHHNQGDEKSPIGVNAKVDYFHVTFGKTKHTFWKGLALTKTQVEKLDKVYVDHLCGK